MPTKLKLAIILTLAFAFSIALFSITQAKTIRLIKTANDPKVFLVDNNRRVHIPNPSVFEAGGYKWSDIKIVSQKEMKKIPDTALIKSPVDAKVYLVENGAKQWIPDEKTFLNAGLKWSDIVIISQPQVEFYGEKEFKPESILEIAKPEIKTEPADIVDNTAKAPVSQPVVSNNNTIEPTIAESNYQRPASIIVQDIGRYEHVLPEYSSFSISASKLFNNGEVFVSKSVADGKEIKSDIYIWNNGILTPYTEADYLHQKNDKGEKIVSILSSSDPYFLSNGKKTKLPTLGGFSTNVNDLNNLGMAVGWSEVSGGGLDGGVGHAFLWQKGIMKDLGTLGGEESVAEAINNKGQIVGYSHDKNKQGYAFIWENGKMKKISAEGYDFAFADDINDNNLILGKLKTNENNCSSFACRTEVYLKDGKINYSEVAVDFLDVNNLDEIVGVSEDAYLIDNIVSRYPSEHRSEIADRAMAGSVGTRGNAVLYADGDVMRLDDLLADDDIVFTSAKAINDRGEILASGFNYADSYSHEYLISLPKDIPPTFRFTVDGERIIFGANEEKPEGYDEQLKYKITWIDTDTDDNAKISLYYYYSGIGHPSTYQGQGELLVSGLSEDSSVDSFVWDMSGYKSGNYYLYAEIDDGNIKRRFDSDRLKVVKKARLDEAVGISIQRWNETPEN